MNAFNRVVLIILAVVAIVFSTTVFLLTGGVVRPSQISPGGLLSGLWSFFADLDSAEATIAVAVCVLVVILAVILLLLELNVFQREPTELVVRQDRLGTVTIARSSVRKLVGHEAAAVPGVMETRQAVDERLGGLRVHMRVLLFPEADAPVVGHTLQERVQQAIQTHVGLTVSEVQVATQLEPFEKSRRPRVH